MNTFIKRIKEIMWKKRLKKIGNNLEKIEKSYRELMDKKHLDNCRHSPFLFSSSTIQGYNELLKIYRILDSFKSAVQDDIRDFREDLE